MLTMSKIFFFAFVFIFLTAITIESTKVDSSSHHRNTANVSEPDYIDDIFMDWWLIRRDAHLSAVKELKAIDSYNEKFQLVVHIFRRTMKIFSHKRRDAEEVRERIIKRKTLSGLKDHSKDAVTKVLITAASFGDFVLHMPEISHDILDRVPHWRSDYEWALIYLNSTRFLLDSVTKRMVDLVVQELNILPRKPKNLNPNSHEHEDIMA